MRACCVPGQAKKMTEAGYVLGNLDATIIAQKPKLSPHKVVGRALTALLMLIRAVLQHF